MTPAQPIPRKPFVRETLVQIPICPRCKRQDSHAPDCDNDGFVIGIYRRTDTFERFDTKSQAPVSFLKFAYSHTPTNWQASPDGREIKYFDSMERNGEGWVFLKMMVEGVSVAR